MGKLTKRHQDNTNVKTASYDKLHDTSQNKDKGFASKNYERLYIFGSVT